MNDSEGTISCIQQVLHLTKQGFKGYIKQKNRVINQSDANWSIVTALLIKEYAGAIY